MQSLKQLDKRLKQLEKELPAQAKSKLQQAEAYRAEVERLKALWPYQTADIRKKHGIVDPHADAIDRHFLRMQQQRLERLRIRRSQQQSVPGGTLALEGNPGAKNAQPAKPETVEPIAAPTDTRAAAPAQPSENPLLWGLSPEFLAGIDRIRLARGDCKLSQLELQIWPRKGSFTR